MTAKTARSQDPGRVVIPRPRSFLSFRPVVRADHPFRVAVALRPEFRDAAQPLQRAARRRDQRHDRLCDDLRHHLRRHRRERRLGRGVGVLAARRAGDQAALAPGCGGGLRRRPGHHRTQRGRLDPGQVEHPRLRGDAGDVHELQGAGQSDHPRLPHHPVRRLVQLLGPGVHRQDHPGARRPDADHRCNLLFPEHADRLRPLGLQRGRQRGSGAAVRHPGRPHPDHHLRASAA